MKRHFLNSLILFLNFIFGCVSNEQDMEEAKMNCYTEKLKQIKKMPLYREVMTQFEDTFKVMKNDK